MTRNYTDTGMDHKDRVVAKPAVNMNYGHGTTPGAAAARLRISRVLRHVGRRSIRHTDPGPRAGWEINTCTAQSADNRWHKTKTQRAGEPRNTNKRLTRRPERAEKLMSTRPSGEERCVRLRNQQ